jgi:catechol 2,3-dioxygenase-like lactoylglutathione lyase family enzyme
MRFGHINIVARDWRALAAFYCAQLGCTLLAPERDLSGPLIDGALGVSDARINGVHVRLPGFGDGGPTIEIYRYEPLIEAGPASVRRTGFGHIAFQVDDIATVRAAIVAAGGSITGDVVTTTAGTRQVSWCYVTDPEGNGIELQTWH